MKVGAVFILYNPDELVIRKLKEYYLTYNEIKIFIVDNSPKKIDSLQEEFSGYYHYNGNVGGISGALNIGIENLINFGCDYFFTFDQDSELPSDFFTSMASFVSEKHAKLVCPNFYDINSKTYGTFVKLSRWKYEVIANPKKTAFAISSGMGFSIDTWHSIGGFDNDYIIDHVDTKFCLIAHEKNIPIYVNYDVCLKHEIGNRIVRKFLGVTLKPNNHNEIRKYYIVRNGTILSFDYFFKYPSYFYLNILRVCHEFACVILYEKNKIRKIRFMIKGLYHAVIRKVGPVKN